MCTSHFFPGMLDSILYSILYSMVTNFLWHNSDPPQKKFQQMFGISTFTEKPKVAAWSLIFRGITLAPKIKICLKNVWNFDFYGENEISSMVTNFLWHNSGSPQKRTVRKKPMEFPQIENIDKLEKNLYLQSGSA